MSLSAAAMRLLADKGLSLDDIIAVAAANEAERVVSALEKRRAYDRERKAKAKAERNSTGKSTGIPGAPENPGSANSNGIPPEIPPETPPLARVDTKQLTTEVSGLAAAVVETRAANASDWPEGNAHVWSAALVALAQTSRLDPSKQPGLTMTLGRLMAWKTAGASWEFDVVPIVCTMAQKPGTPIATWKFFEKCVLQQVADNRQALTLPEARHDRDNHHSGRPFAERGQPRSDANLSAAMRALDRRRGRAVDPVGNADERRPAELVRLPG